MPVADIHKISPSVSLEYHPCFEGFQCARLEVPLNWNETVEGESDKAAIAVIKKPSKVAVTDPRYGGIILFNPGNKSTYVRNECIATCTDAFQVDLAVPELVSYSGLAMPSRPSWTHLSCRRMRCVVLQRMKNTSTS